METQSIIAPPTVDGGAAFALDDYRRSEEKSSEPPLDQHFRSYLRAKLMTEAEHPQLGP